MVALNDGERIACSCSDGDIAILNVARSETEEQWSTHDEGIRRLGNEGS